MTSASAAPPSASLPRIESLPRTDLIWPISDLGVEDFGIRFDRFVADLRGELHRELRFLDRGDHRADVLRLPGGQRLRLFGGDVLRFLEAVDRVREHGAV